MGIDSLCGALALLLVKADERDRAFRVFDAVAAAAEDETGFGATSTDRATPCARRLVRPGCFSATLRRVTLVQWTLDAVLQAALGNRNPALRQILSTRD
jgi:hypothetical protein